MKIYNIEVKEVLAKTIKIKADTEQSALHQIEMQYKNKEIVLDSQLVSIKSKDNNKTYEALIMDIVNYLWYDEKRHFEEYDEPPQDHIFLKILKIKEILEQQAPLSKKAS